MTDAFYGILIPFLGTSLGAASVFFLKQSLGDHIQRALTGFAAGVMVAASVWSLLIIHFVQLEALNWCKTAIPIGCALGTVTCWVLCLILRFVVKGEWVDMPLFAVSASGIFSGAVVGVVTVFIAAHSPARQAARVSPAAAVSGNADASSHYAAHAARPGLLKVETSLGIHHAMGARKNLFLMTGSFALMIVLFLAFSACLDIVHKLLPSVNSHLTPDFSIYSVDDTNSLDPGMADEIVALPGVKCTYGTMSRTAQPARINGAETTIDLYSYGDAMLDDAKRSVASGDLSKVYGDSGYALAIFSDATRLNVGDSVTVNGQTLEIACVLSEGIGSISGAPVIVCSGETFTRLTGETHYMLLNVLAEKDISDAAVQKLYALAGDAAVSDNRELQSEVNGSYWVFRLAAYGFLAIISLITVLNIVNSISMGVSACTRQYGAMRAVGMEGRSRYLCRLRHRDRPCAGPCAPSHHLCKDRHHPLRRCVEGADRVHCAGRPAGGGLLCAGGARPGQAHPQYAHHGHHQRTVTSGPGERQNAPGAFAVAAALDGYGKCAIMVAPTTM